MSTLTQYLILLVPVYLLPETACLAVSSKNVTEKVEEVDCNPTSSSNLKDGINRCKEQPVQTVNSSVSSARSAVENRVSSKQGYYTKSSRENDHIPESFKSMVLQ